MWRYRNRAEEEKLNGAAYRKRLVDAFGRAIQDLSPSDFKKRGQSWINILDRLQHHPR
jgi:hypothetical protein